MRSQDKANQIMQDITDAFFEKGCSVNLPAVKEASLIVINEVMGALNVAMPAQVFLYWEEVKQHINQP